MKSAWHKTGLIAAILLSGQLAVAQPAVHEEQSPAKLAQEWAEKGKAFFEKGDYAGAILALNEAERHLHSPTFVHFSGLAHEKLGKLREARRLHQSVVDAKLSSTSPQEWENAQKESAKAIQALDRRIPTLELVVAGSQARDLTVMLDGVRLDNTQLGRPSPQDPGKHTIVVEAPGHGKSIREIELKEAAREQVKVQLPPETGAAVVDPSTRPAAPAGPISPTSVHAPGEVLSMPASDNRTKAGYVTIGVGAAALVVGVVAGGVATAKRSDAREQCGPDFEANRCRADRSSALEEARAAAGVATAGFVLTGLGAAAGVVLFAWPKLAPQTRMGARGGLFTIEGVF